MRRSRPAEATTAETNRTCAQRPPTTGHSRAVERRQRGSNGPYRLRTASSKAERGLLRLGAELPDHAIDPLECDIDQLNLGMGRDQDCVSGQAIAKADEVGPKCLQFWIN